jgi:hypothetical protein
MLAGWRGDMKYDKSACTGPEVERIRVYLFSVGASVPARTDGERNDVSNGLVGPRQRTLQAPDKPGRQPLVQGLGPPRQPTPCLPRVVEVEENDVPWPAMRRWLRLNTRAAGGSAFRPCRLICRLVTVISPWPRVPKAEDESLMSMNGRYRQSRESTEGPCARSSFLHPRLRQCILGFGGRHYRANCWLVGALPRVAQGKRTVLG